ncbi:MAG TPA: hypothetical protein VGO83_11845 [Thermoleophilaceae bacterium]|nr:hypothetical protein [Thermoleophilaceae bacterium]
MAWQRLDNGIQLDAPRLAVALVQSEAEMLHSPARDVSGFLRGHGERWRIESFTERTFDAVDKIASSFDCVVIGFNAVCHHGGIGEALRAAQTPHSNLLILHQKDHEALGFLEDGLGIDLQPLEAQAFEAHARERREYDELLLNWPRAVLAGGSVQQAIPCQASSWLRFSEDSHWRTVLEVENGGRRVPVMVRTSTTLDRRIVVCSAWLDPRDDKQHARLLENAIAYCAQGRPEIAVVAERAADGAQLPPAALLARKLRLQGASTVEIAPDPGVALRFDRWPLCEVSAVVFRNGEQPEDYLRDDAAAHDGAVSWMQSGGTLVGVNNGRFTLHTGLSDTHWVAQRWALWFHAVDEARWLDGIFRARSVLQVLTKIQSNETRADPERLGLDRDIEELAPQLAALVRAELGGRDHVNGLVSATAAALDIDRLVGRRVLSDEERAGIEAWLRQAFPQASLEERFDVARALGESGRELFADAVTGTSGPLSVVSLIRMREAAAACRAEGAATGEARLEKGSLSELDSRPQLCAEFLAVMTESDLLLVDRAVTTLAKHGVLVRADDRLSENDAETICTEALGLMSYFNMTGEATLPARPETVGLPTGAVEPVLKETRRARAQELEARSKMERLARPLAMAQFVLLLEAIVLSLALALAIVLITSLNFDTLTLFGVAVATATTAFVLFALALVRAELYPTWGRAMAATVSQGIPGLKRRLAALTSEEQAPKP